MGNNYTRILNVKEFREKTLKSKKCQKCTYYELKYGCALAKIKTILLQTNIQKCKNFGKIEKPITGDF